MQTLDYKSGDHLWEPYHGPLRSPRPTTIAPGPSMAARLLPAQAGSGRWPGGPFQVFVTCALASSQQHSHGSARFLIQDSRKPMLQCFGRTKFLFLVFSHNFSVSSASRAPSLRVVGSLGQGLQGSQSGLWNFVPLTCHPESIWMEGAEPSYSPHFGFVSLLMGRHWQSPPSSQRAGQSSWILRHCIKLWGRGCCQSTPSWMRESAGKAEMSEAWEPTLAGHQLRIVRLYTRQLQATLWGRTSYPHSTDENVVWQKVSCLLPQEALCPCWWGLGLRLRWDLGTGAAWLRGQRGQKRSLWPFWGQRDSQK